MPDYQKMYLELMRATERAINILVEAQQKSEEIYIETSDSEEKPPIIPPEKSESRD